MDRWGGGKNEFSKAFPLSVTKLMTASIVLDYLSVNDMIVVEAEDIVSTTGIQFRAGDRLCVHDALIEMLLSSNNTLANTLSRVVQEYL